MPTSEQPSPATSGAVSSQTGTPPGTRAAVEKLEGQIKEMGHGANEAVSGAIQGVRDGAHAVQDAIGHAATDAATYAKKALDIRRHVRRHPWLAVGCAAALGFVCSGLLSRR